MKLPAPNGEILRAAYARYFDDEEWEKCYSLHTGELRRIGRYAGMDILDILDLPYSAFLLLRRDSWVDSWMQSEEGREFLKTLWRLQQTEADVQAVRGRIAEQRG